MNNLIDLQKTETVQIIIHSVCIWIGEQEKNDGIFKSFVMQIDGVN